jgi:hypothetical protein
VDRFLRALDALPMPALFALYIAAGLALMFALEYVVHHRYPAETRERVSASTAVMIQVLAVFYSVLVAFVIVGERSAITDANSHVTAEAAAMSALFHDTAGFPAEDRQHIREAILAYDQSVLHHDFAAVENTGNPSSRTTTRLTQLYSAVQSAEPRVGWSAFYRQAVSDLTEITKARRDRNASAGNAIPGPLFFLVVLLSALMLGVATLLNTRERGTHVALLAGLTIVMSLNLALIVALEHPFGGAVAISDKPLRVGVLFAGAH